MAWGQRSAGGVWGSIVDSGLVLDVDAVGPCQLAYVDSATDDVYIQWVSTAPALKYVVFDNSTGTLGSAQTACSISSEYLGRFVAANYVSVNGTLVWVYATSSTAASFYAYIIGSSPTNDDLSVTLSSTDNLYPLKTYSFEYDGHNDDGADKLKSLTMNFTDGATVVASFRYDVSAATFSIPVGSSNYTLVTSSCSSLAYENWLNVTFAVKAYMNATEHEDLAVKLILTDGSSTDTDTLLTGLDVQRTFTVSSLSASDNPVPAPGSTQVRATALFGSGGTGSDFVVGDFIEINGTTLAWSPMDNRFQALVTQTGPASMKFSNFTASYLLGAGNFTGTISSPLTVTWYTPPIGGTSSTSGTGWQTGSSTQTQTQQGAPIPTGTDVPLNWLAQNGQAILLILLAATFGIFFLTPKKGSQKRSDGLDDLLIRPGKVGKSLGKWWRKVRD